MSGALDTAYRNAASPPNLLPSRAGFRLSPIRESSINVSRALGLSNADGEDSADLRSLVRRVEIGSDHVVLCLDSAAALRRSWTGEAAGFSKRDLIAHWRAKLGADEQLAEEKELHIARWRFVPRVTV